MSPVLARACKQLQAEFRPLYWHNASIILDSHTLCAFLDTFTDRNIAPLLLAAVTVRFRDVVLSETGLDVLALLSIRARDGKVKLRFEILPARGVSRHDVGEMDLCHLLHSILDRAPRRADSVATCVPTSSGSCLCTISCTASVGVAGNGASSCVRRRPG
jgi:hypothetical protein